MSLIITGIVSLLSGVTASMGLGGGFVLLIYLTAFADMPQMDAQFINLIFFLPIAAISLYCHFRNSLIKKEVILPSVITGVLGVLLGVTLANYFGNEILRKIFAVFLLFIGVRELFFGGKEKN